MNNLHSEKEEVLTNFLKIYYLMPMYMGKLYNIFKKFQKYLFKYICF